jgi:hypothetical protein
MDQINASKRQMREFIVPDESEVQRFQQPVEISDFEAKVKAAREDKKRGIERISDVAKRRIEMLLGITKLIRKVDINGNEFILRTLKSKETRNIFMQAAEFTTNMQVAFEVRRQTLAYSIIGISGVTIEEFLDSDDFNTKLAFVDELDESLSRKLYNEWEILNKESKDKYELSSEEDAKEVVQDLKK